MGATYAITGFGGSEAGRGGKLEGGGGSREVDAVRGGSLGGENCRDVGAGDDLLREGTASNGDLMSLPT